jgi:peptidoglycan glycosyltransferase
LLLLPLAWLSRFTLVAASPLSTRADNPRHGEDLRLRGSMVDRRGVCLARTAGIESRTYPAGELTCHTVGYWNVRFGQAGLEDMLAPRLRGLGPPTDPVMALHNILGQPLEGPAAVLTLDMRLQKLAATLLGARRGAIVALDPRNGDVLASVSWPRFDPNHLADHWEALQHDPNAPLVDRVAQGSYPPGSVFKLVTLACGLQTGVVHPSDTFDCPGYLDVGGYRLHCNQGEVHGHVDVSQALAESCNVAFATMALRLGAERLTQTMRDLLPAAAVVIPHGDADLAQMGFGQGPLSLSPLEVAQVVATIANQGHPVKARLVRGWTTRGRTTAETVPSYPAVLRPDVVATMTSMMVGVVDHGTGTAARLPGVQVAGKTGTAENPHGPPHAWFAAFAPAEAPRIVVVVLIENGGYGGDVAAPVARQIIQTALQGAASQRESL